MATVQLPPPSEADFTAGRRALLALMTPEAQAKVAAEWAAQAAKPKPYRK